MAEQGGQPRAGNPPRIMLHLAVKSGRHRPGAHGLRIQFRQTDGAQRQRKGGEYPAGCADDQFGAAAPYVQHQGRGFFRGNGIRQGAVNQAGFTAAADGLQRDSGRGAEPFLEFRAVDGVAHGGGGDGGDGRAEPARVRCQPARGVQRPAHARLAQPPAMRAGAQAGDNPAFGQQTRRPARTDVVNRQARGIGAQVQECPAAGAAVRVFFIHCDKSFFQERFFCLPAACSKSSPCANIRAKDSGRRRRRRACRVCAKSYATR